MYGKEVPTDNGFQYTGDADKDGVTYTYTTTGSPRCTITLAQFKKVYAQGVDIPNEAGAIFHPASGTSWIFLTDTTYKWTSYAWYRGEITFPLNNKKLLVSVEYNSSNNGSFQWSIYNDNDKVGTLYLSYPSKSLYISNYIFDPKGKQWNKIKFTCMNRQDDSVKTPVYNNLGVTAIKTF